MERLNILNITPEHFDNNVFGCNSHFDQVKYNKWLKNAVATLKHIYNSIDENDYVEPSCLYSLGDIINMLDSTRILINKQ